MTPEEAIEFLKRMQNKKIDYAEMVCAPAFAYGYQYVYPEPEDYAIEEAIKALEEVQQYRDIGTVEECKELASMVNMAERNELAKAIDEWLKYNKIGTVEECREAREKQIPKKPKDSLKIDPVIDGNGAYVDADTTVYLLCPNCGEMVGIDENVYKFCRECGQAIDTENLEGMEDEGKTI